MDATYSKFGKTDFYEIMNIDKKLNIINTMFA